MFHGSIPALITPFRNGIVDERAFQSLVEWQIAQGSSALVPCGTTGEASTLSLEEHKRVVQLCVEAAAGKVPVIAGAGSNDTAAAIELAQAAKDAGANAALLVAPYYNKPSQDGLYAHYKAINDAVDLPMVIYNVPSRTIVDISVETMSRIAKLPNVVGVKDVTSDLSRVAVHGASCGESFAQLSGDDHTALDFCVLGGVGVISVTANVAPKACAEVQAALKRGDLAAARALDAKLAGLHKMLFCEPSPSPVKYAASVLKLCGEDVRLPLIPCSEAAREKVNAALKQAELI